MATQPRRYAAIHSTGRLIKHPQGGLDMNDLKALLASLTLIAAVGLFLSSLAAVIIGMRLTVLANRQRMPLLQRLRYGWAGPLSMLALRDHPDEQIRRWARGLRSQPRAWPHSGVCTDRLHRREGAGPAAVGAEP